jgi:type II secretion system protein G
MLFYRNPGLSGLIESKFIYNNLCEGKKMKTRKGFTLVEILIVVVILGILAAIVIPQFTNASTAAKESNLKSNLQTVRSQIELYKIHNNDTPPADATALVSALTTPDANGNCYMKAIPDNPFIKVNANTVGGTSASAWVYTVTGTYNANFNAGADTTTESSMHQSW